MDENFISPKTEQLIIKTIGKKDSELGLRFLAIESQWSRGFRVKETIKLQSEYEFLFILERQVKE